MANTAIVGINWGDEGKGRRVDLLTEEGAETDLDLGHYPLFLGFVKASLEGRK